MYCFLIREINVLPLLLFLILDEFQNFTRNKKNINYYCVMYLQKTSFNRIQTRHSSMAFVKSSFEKLINA